MSVFPIWTNGRIPTKISEFTIQHLLYLTKCKRFFKLYNLPLSCNLSSFYSSTYCLSLTFNLLFVTLNILFLLQFLTEDGLLKLYRTSVLLMWLTYLEKPQETHDKMNVNMLSKIFGKISFCIYHKKLF